MSDGSELQGEGAPQAPTSAAGGVGFLLGTQNPNALAPLLTLEGGVKARAGTQGNIKFWNTPLFGLTYADGTVGYTGRWHLHASGGAQAYTWLTERGFLGNAKDLKSQEMTAFIRVHDLDPSEPALQGIHLKVRGGRHTSVDGNLAACVMMEYRPAGIGASTVRFAKEPDQPHYDDVSRTQKVNAGLTENVWVGLKLVPERGVDERPALALVRELLKLEELLLVTLEQRIPVAPRPARLGIRPRRTPRADVVVMLER